MFIEFNTKQINYCNSLHCNPREFETVDRKKTICIEILEKI